MFLSRSLKAQLDAVSIPRVRKCARPCDCGASDWTPCFSDPSASTAYYICEVCRRRRKVTKMLASVTSATDGSGVADVMIREFFEDPALLTSEFTLHAPIDSVMIGLYMPYEMHRTAKQFAADRGTTLSCLLASIIAAKLPKAPRVRTQKRVAA